MKVYFLVFPDILLLDLAGIAEAFRIANQNTPTPIFELLFVGPEKKSSSSIGLSLAGLSPLPKHIEDNAWIIVCGLPSPEGRIEAGAARDIIAWLRTQVRPTHTVCCVCAGALIAAEAGLLEGRQCTSHHDHCEWLQKRHPEAQVQTNRIFVRDGNVYTSAGVTSGIDLALTLIAEQAGAVIAARVARDLVVYIRRAGHDPQISVWLTHRNHLHPVVHHAQDEVVRDPGHPWTLPELAARCHVSVRTLSRLFRREAGITPLDYLAQIRLAIARERLQTTHMSIDRVAESAGFRSALQLRRLWKKHDEGSPAQLRKRVANA